MRAYYLSFSCSFALAALLGCAQGSVEVEGSGGQGGAGGGGSASSSSSGGMPVCQLGHTQACYSGPPGTKGIGACKEGTQTCDAKGMWSLCIGEVKPQAETCDGIDNDCNGTIDENIPTVTCGLGACAATAIGCVNGKPGTCTPGTPSPEMCDGIDNDCNGMIDDNLGTLSCGLGACAVTIQSCQNGQTQVCVPKPGSPEICDGLDNDCNGMVDDLGSVTCGVGACKVTVQACLNGMMQQCVPGVPSPEMCGDAIDNNCNGMIDEGCPVICGNGMVDPGEQCDDGNMVDNDACTNTCKLGVITVYGNQYANLTAGLTAIPEAFTAPANQSQWGVPSSVGVIMISNDGGVSAHPDYTAHLNSGAHLLVIGGSADASYTTWIQGYVNTDNTASWHQSNACVSDWNKLGAHAITQFLPATYEFTNVSTSYHMLHFPTAQPVNAQVLGVSCEGASANILVTRRYPTGGTFTYLAFDIGNYSDPATQTGFMIPFLQGYLKYVRSPH